MVYQIWMGGGAGGGGDNLLPFQKGKGLYFYRFGEFFLGFTATATGTASAKSMHALINSYSRAQLNMVRLIGGPHEHCMHRYRTTNLIADYFTGTSRTDPSLCHIVCNRLVKYSLSIIDYDATMPRCLLRFDGGRNL